MPFKLLQQGYLIDSTCLSRWLRYGLCLWAWLNIASPELGLCAPCGSVVQITPKFQWNRGWWNWVFLVRQIKLFG